LQLISRAAKLMKLKAFLKCGYTLGAATHTNVLMGARGFYITGDVSPAGYSGDPWGAGW
jgi:hypothetical protein